MSNYEKYKLQWMLDHGYTLQDLIQSLTEYQQADPEDIERASTPITELFEEWQQDIGFRSEIWVCEQEWLDYEGNDDEMMFENPCAESNNLAPKGQGGQYDIQL